jgi:fructose-1,6-bisphosphatase I
MAIITLSRFLIEEERNKQIICADLRFLVEIVSRACKAISIAIGKGSLAGVLGGAGTDNVQGEAQKKLPTRSCSRPTNGADIWPPWPPRKWKILT